MDFQKSTYAQLNMARGKQGVNHRSRRTWSLIVDPELRADGDADRDAFSLSRLDEQVGHGQASRGQEDKASDEHCRDPNPSRSPHRSAQLRPHCHPSHLCLCYGIGEWAMELGLAC